MGLPSACAVCGNATSKRCSRCKMVNYCSDACQRSDWNSGHKYGCRDFQSSVKGNSEQSASTLQRRYMFGTSFVPFGGKNNQELFPYEEFLNYFYWGGSGYPPRRLINCGNSCFANVVLQCLTQTRPLLAYLLERGHRRECRSNGWCFLCEFQLHVEQCTWCQDPFSPIDVLSGLPNIGGNLSCGKQEDAHEFMRFAIDTMQSAVLAEFDGDKAEPLSAEETTIIQHIFGGRLQSQVACTACGNHSNQFENMMDLTVGINGEADSLEKCLDQFTAEECMDGEDMYKCDRCNDYVKAWKRLTILEAPNILTIALKRFKVIDVGIDDVLAQQAYMLFYSRHLARPTSLCPLESLNKLDKAEGKQHSTVAPLECHKTTVSPAICANPGSLPTDKKSVVFREEEELTSVTNYEGDTVDSGASREVLQELQDVRESSADRETYLRKLSATYSFIDCCSEAVMQKAEGRCPVSDNEEKSEMWRSAAYESLFGSSSEDEDSLTFEEYTEICEGNAHESLFESPREDSGSSSEDEDFLTFEEYTEICEGNAHESLFESPREDSGEMPYDSSSDASDSSSS
ncbi:ubiquitin carboxyl-terminal hydrolase 19 isoform X2 [Solanum pennellii]|uniref:Ubiquitin carboxyl-terminal hydrolase 19 isoform X2 n=1 Tax=Solanum pennellii TaxID=28526 RepID=A0ABM1FTG0_SOLPN|nr:ubiquitin carboxyl-terminal hydrolase 19 isoform X2 [Solanum pennellii]